jgi:hypothetical protein
MALKMGHERLCRDALHHFPIDPTILLKKAKDDTFASGYPTLLTPSWYPQSKTRPSQSHQRALPLRAQPYEKVLSSIPDTLK